MSQAFPSALVLPGVKQLALGDAEVMDELFSSFGLGVAEISVKLASSAYGVCASSYYFCWLVVWLCAVSGCLVVAAVPCGWFVRGVGAA